MWSVAGGTHDQRGLDLNCGILLTPRGLQSASGSSSLPSVATQVVSEDPSPPAGGHVPHSDSSPQTTSIRAERAPALGRQSLKNKGCTLAKTDLLFPGLGCSSPRFLSFLSAAGKAGDVTESTAPPGLLRAPSLLTMAVILTRRGLAYRPSLPSHPSEVGVTESLLKSRSDQVTPQLQTPPYLLSQVLRPRT